MEVRVDQRDQYAGPEQGVAQGRIGSAAEGNVLVVLEDPQSARGQLGVEPVRPELVIVTNMPRSREMDDLTGTHWARSNSDTGGGGRPVLLDPRQSGE